MRFDDVIQRLIENRPRLKKEFQRYRTYSEISNLITAARLHKGLSQEELAKLVKTKQPSIARLESGKALPSVGFLDRIAKALHTALIIRFDFMEETQSSTQIIHHREDDNLERGILYSFGSNSSESKSKKVW